ncbi:hypothetical protein K504DRAFT_447512 [Pleomassaria siparia CBS 279.74]|uniref:Uncharacterized protein n=1 Tax=Pleomassaria siparia CBS 279.74 TaxID=1314801 RepID=A0A6G1K1A0_9PLEO|nr:hypothetical protein K504DRAFT_447512 [Pleomassaria siparia CBS 279.74]
MTTPQRAPPPPTIDLLLNLIDTRPNSILTSLLAHPSLASASDSHGYSLVHAAVSYAQLPVLRELIGTYKVDVNLLDEDGETPLFAAEKEDVARCLVEEMGADWRIRNSEGKTAEEKVAEEEGEAHEVCQYLRGVRETGTSGEGSHAPPLLPNGVKVNVGSMEEEDAGDAPDPEIRRRIEVWNFCYKHMTVFGPVCTRHCLKTLLEMELAARDDFQTEEGQRQLRELVSEVVTGMGAEQAGRHVRRRAD